MSDTRRPFISVCIPAYKHAEYLRRLLGSLDIQTFRDFEVVITDDSPDQSVADLVKQFSSLNIHYHKNDWALGTPANWNQSIKLAVGEWIKLMHDDDWFASADSLRTYVDTVKANPKTTFFFCAYNNVTVGRAVTLKQKRTEDETGLPVSGQFSDYPQMIRPGRFRLARLSENPVTLLSKNIIGPPSVVIHKNDKEIFYDPNLKWLVDMDFYIRYLETNNSFYIDQPLVNIGINELQVTKSSSLVREVEIPEHFMLLEKTGIQQLNNLLVYDAWWRLMRNLKIRDVIEIAEAGYRGVVPIAIRNIIRFQKAVPYSLLKSGPVSKSLMMINYMQNKVSGALK